MTDTLSILLAGVGGQGTILASDLLAHVGLAAGLDVKQAEVHGMSQRGGSVTSYVRWGKRVYSPAVAPGEVDALVAFERVEALRYLHHLRPGGLAIINLATIVPVTVSSLGQQYPSEDETREAVAHLRPPALFVDGPGIAQRLGDMKVMNTVLLGALSAALEGQAAIASEYVAPEPLWLDVIARRAPRRYVELNQRAFLAGRSSVLAMA